MPATASGRLAPTTTCSVPATTGRRDRVARSWAIGSRPTRTAAARRHMSAHEPHGDRRETIGVVPLYGHLELFARLREAADLEGTSPQFLVLKILTAAFPEPEDGREWGTPGWANA